MNNRRILLWITILVIIAGIFIGLHYANTGAVKKSASQAPAVGTAKQGAKAPQFATATNKGYFNLDSVNKPVFLEVFATWCPHCQRETKIIDRLYQQYKNRAQFIAIPGSNTGMDGRSPSDEQDVLNFVSAFSVQYPVALYDPSLQIANQYLQGGFPTMAVIDRNKTISYITSGETSYAELSSAIQKAL
jgi:thiol-disulfide isomerase/thioredoxin